MNCPECNGKGKIELFTSAKTCGVCGGTGQRPALLRRQVEFRKDAAPCVWPIPQMDDAHPAAKIQLADIASTFDPALGCYHVTYRLEVDGCE
jgi:hypothetical protein